MSDTEQEKVKLHPSSSAKAFEMLKPKINKKFLHIKAHYFLWYAGLSPVVPYMSVYARQLGFSSIAVGIIYTVSPLAIILIKPITGAISDKFKCQKIFFIISQLIIILATIGLIFLPSYSKSSEKLQISKVKSEENVTAVEVCTDQNITGEFGRERFNLCEFNCTTYLNTPRNVIFTSKVFLNKSKDGDCFEAKIKNSEFSSQNFFISSSSEVLTCSIDCQITKEYKSWTKSEESEVYNAYQYWILFFVFLMHMIGRGITIIFGDAICFNILGNTPYKYGYQRMFGALGWGIFSISCGFIIDAASSGSFKKNYTPTFLLAAGIMVVYLIVSSQLQYTEHQVSKNIFKDMTRVLSNVRIIVFILWCLFLGTATTLSRHYLFWFLDDLAKEYGSEGNIKTIQGIALGLKSLGGDLPCFFISGWVLKRVKHVYIMCLIMFVIGVRVLLYSIISNPVWCIPLEVLHGLTFGIYYSTMTSYASIIAAPGTKTTTQGLVGAVYEGAGNSLGSLLGGFLYDKYGGSMMYRIFGYASLIAFLVFSVIQLLIAKYCKQEGQLEDGESDADIPLRNVDSEDDEN